VQRLMATWWSRVALVTIQLLDLSRRTASMLVRAMTR